MELRDYLRVLRARWLLVFATTILAVGAALALTLTTTKLYTATTELFVWTQSGGDASELLSGTAFTQQQVQSYVRVVSTPSVLQPVIDRLQLDTTASKLGQWVSASAPQNTVLIDVSVKNQSPSQAALIANAVGEQFRTTIVGLAPSTSGASPIQVTVVQRAAVPHTQSSPDLSLNLAVGLFLGLTLGIASALLRHVLDTSVKGEDEVAAITESPILGHIAFDDEAASHPLLVQADPYGSRAEAFRALRTNLQFVGVGDRPRSTVITSSVPAEGKSTTTANLALTLAAAGSTVAIVEADLRRPRIAQYFGLEDAAGLTDVLIGRAALDEVLQPWGDDARLSILACGPLPPNPSELLGSDGMKTVLDNLVARFDHVLVDAPPLLPFTDAAVLSRVTGGTLMIVGSKRIDRDGLRRALEILERVDTTLLGVVLNLVPIRPRSGYGYGYGYRYGYGYGYRYGDNDRNDGPGRGGRSGGKRGKRRPQASRPEAALRTAVLENPGLVRQAAGQSDDRSVREPVVSTLSKSGKPAKTTDSRPDRAATVSGQS